MISVRSPLTIVALVAMATAFATLASAHDHHHHHNGGGFSLWVAPNGKSMTENLQDCLCWNSTTNEWCHNADDGGHKGFWRPSCARVVYANTWWWIPVILWCIYLILMPLCMCAFRLCCNCCGGRAPSYGCCCPISNGVLSPDPKWVRPYSKCSTWTAKILAAIFAVLILALSINSLKQNNHVTDAVHHTVQETTQFVLRQSGYLVTGDLSRFPTAKFADAATYGPRPSWMPVTAYNIVQRAQTFAPTLQSILDDLPKVYKYDNADRVVPIRVLVAIPLTITLIVTLLAFLNVRSWPISISAGLLSFFTFGIVIMASIVGTIGAGFTLVCNQPSLAQEFATSTLKGNGFCDVPEFAAAVNTTQIAFMHHLCKDRGLSAMMTPAALKGWEAPYSICDERVGGMLSMQYFDSQVQTTYSWPTNADVPVPFATWDGPKKAHVAIFRLVAIINNASLAPVVDANGFAQSLYSCGQNKTCPMHKQWFELPSQLSVLFTGLQYLYRANDDCAWVKTAFNNLVMPTMCGYVTSSFGGSQSLNDTVNSLAGQLFGLAVVTTFAFWVWMNGSKRFTKGATAEEMQEHHTMQRLNQEQHRISYDYITQQNAAASCPQPHGTYNDGVNGPRPYAAPEIVTSAPKQPATDAVANTVEAPLLLQHDTPVYPTGSVNSRSECEEEMPVKEQPQPI